MRLISGGPRILVDKVAALGTHWILEQPLLSDTKQTRLFLNVLFFKLAPPEAALQLQEGSGPGPGLDGDAPGVGRIVSGSRTPALF